MYVGRSSFEMGAVAENPRGTISSVPFKYEPKVAPSPPQALGLHSEQQKLFPSHLDTIRNVSPHARVLCDILSKASPHEVEPALSLTGLHVTHEIVEEVLKLSYGNPAGAVTFFRWAGMTQKHSAYAWNLIVDLLGKNESFEPMWDAIRSMKTEGVLSVATFVSVFGNYCASGRFNEAFMSFDVMERHGIQPDVVAVNSLLSAICREGRQTSKALEFFERIKTKIPPDADSFAILLDGWENEGNVAKAKTTFGEMVIRVGWSPQNLPAYNAFLNTLVCGSQVDEAIKFLQVMQGKNCSPGLKFFSNTLDILIEQNDSAHALSLWNVMVCSGLIPNLTMFNAMIGLLCNNDDIHNAYHFLDSMVFYGVFPDSLIYNMIFKCLVKNKKVREGGKFFYEMIKNEWPPTHSNCAAAIAMLLDGDDPEMAIEIWHYMTKNPELPLDESANALLTGLCSMGRLSELTRFARDMFDRRLIIYESTMAKLKNAFCMEGRSGREIYDDLSRKWKSL